MTSPAGKRLRLLGSVLSVLVLVAGAFVAWFYYQMRASLPQLDGTAALAGLSAPVSMTRDAQGVPTINAATRADAASALGYHGFSFSHDDEKGGDTDRSGDEEDFDFKLCSKLIHPTALMLNHPEATIGDQAIKKLLAVEVLFYAWLIVNRFCDLVWHG